MKGKRFFVVKTAMLILIIVFSLTICDNNNTPSISRSFSVSTLTSFGVLEPYYTQPDEQTVTITNTGTEIVTLTQPNATNYIIGTLSTTNLATKGAIATFTVQPRAGLEVGTYNETINVNGTNGDEAKIKTVFAVMTDSIVKPLMLSSKASPTNIVFLGDGFILEDLIFGGLFDVKVAELLDYIFSIQPFAEYKDYFSAYWVSAVSTDRGAKSNPNDSTPNTVFNSTYNYLGTDRLLVSQNISKVMEYTRLVTSNPHLIIMIVNDNRYGGSGGEFVVSSLNQLSKEIAIHEIGHIFTLVDEYVDDEYRQAAGITLSDAALKPNVDVTNNSSKIKWKHFIGRNGYNDNAWEGGYYFAKGVWRPTKHSIMESYTIMQFNAISRETIVKKIIENAEETYSLTDFFIRDRPPSSLRNIMPVIRGSDNPMPVPVEVYANSLYVDQKIRARFKGEEE